MTRESDRSPKEASRGGASRLPRKRQGAEQGMKEGERRGEGRGKRGVGAIPNGIKVGATRFIPLGSNTGIGNNPLGLDPMGLDPLGLDQGGGWSWIQSVWASNGF